MMKDSTVGILLFLLSLAVTQRNISAYGTPAPGIPAPVIPAAAVEMIEGASLLNEAMRGLPPVDISGLASVITEMEKTMSIFPIKLPSSVRQQVLGNLYQSQDKIVQIRGVLLGLANQIKSECEGLMLIFDTNPGVYSIGILNYSAKKFVKLAKHVQKILQDTETKILDVNTYLVNTKNGLVAFKSHIKDAKKQAKEGKGNKSDFWKLLLSGLIDIVKGVFGNSASTVLNAIQNGRQDNEESWTEVIYKLNEIGDSMKDATVSLSGVINSNEKLSAFVQEELRLINNWILAIELSITNHENGIKPEDIEYGIGLYKHKLIDLMNTCDDYTKRNFL